MPSEHVLDTVYPATEEERTQPYAKRLYIVAVILAISLGIVVRAIYVLPAEFPLNDGGMFYTMVQDLQHAGYRLPAFTTYNDAEIPFGYSPFGFYVAGIFEDLTPFDLLDIMRWAPFIVSGLSIVAFYRLASSLLADMAALTAATFAFALLPSSFVWLIMGGGIARSWGFLFAILAVHQVYLLYTCRTNWRIVTTAFWVGLTALSHLGTVSFLTYTLIIFFLIYGRNTYSLISTVLVAIGALVLTAPWWAMVVLTHGWEPFLAAMSSGSSVFSSDPEPRHAVIRYLVQLGVGGGMTYEPFFPLIGVLGLFGILASLTPNRIVLPIWWLSILVLEYRAPATFGSIPTAMLAGICIVDVIIPLLIRGFERVNEGGHRLIADCPDSGRGPLLRHAKWSIVLILSAMACYASASTVVKHPSVRTQMRFLETLSREERLAMQWVSSATPEGSRFLVLPEHEWSFWASDKTAEWFPALATRTDIATVQGSEWKLGQTSFYQRKEQWKLLLPCVSTTPSCFENWAKDFGLTFTHVYISQAAYSKDDSYRLCCKHLIRWLKEDPHYTVIYEKPGAIIFSRQ
jgi:hypothetical protein